MGFTTGLLGGLTLTSSLVYLSLAAHRANRVNQALILRQQTLVLHHIVEPEPPVLPPAYREVHVGLWETAKDRWNSEVERIVKRLYNTDWGVVREGAEQRAAALWRRARQESRDLEKTV